MKNVKFFTAINALMLREIQTRYGRENIGFLWVVFEPLIFVVGVAAANMLLNHRFGSRSIDLLSFVITGYSPFLMWRHCISRSIGAISANNALLYHRAVSVEKIIIARALLEIVGATISLFVIFIILALFGSMKMPEEPLYVFIGWFLMAGFGISSALVVGSISHFSEVFERFMQTFVYVFYPIGGAFYMISWLPMGLRKAAVWVPTANAIEMVRYGQFGDEMHAIFSVELLLFEIMAFAIFGLIASKKLRATLRVE